MILRSVNLNPEMDSIALKLTINYHVSSEVILKGTAVKTLNQNRENDRG